MAILFDGMQVLFMMSSEIRSTIRPYYGVGSVPDFGDE
jgi:hypothetical protein